MGYRSLLLLAALVFLAPEYSLAGQLSYTWEGFRIGDGQPFLFAALIDGDAPDENPDPHSGYYPQALLEFRWDGALLTCGSDREVLLRNDASTGNPLIPYADALFVGCGGILLQLIGHDSALPGDGIPHTLDLTLFDWLRNVQAEGLGTWGEITKVAVSEAVPEPGTILLAAVAFALFPRARRRRERASAAPKNSSGQLVQH